MEAAIVNVHELLDVKKDPDGEDTSMPIYDHLRRVGLHSFAPFFEYHGIRSKKDLTKDVLQRAAAWHPELKFPGRMRDRLAALVEGSSPDLAQAYRLADLSVLLDQFLSAFQAKQQHAKPAISVLPSPSAAAALASVAEAPGAEPSFALADKGTSPTGRRALLRLTSLASSNASGRRADCGPAGMRILELAHEFQVRLLPFGFRVRV